MITLILTRHQAKLILKNIPYGCSIHASDAVLQKILYNKPIPKEGGSKEQNIKEMKLGKILQEILATAS